MLNEVKKAIESLPEISFEEYFQQYVCSTQNRVIDNDIKHAKLNFRSIEDTISVLKGLNQLTEELKR